MVTAIRDKSKEVNAADVEHIGALAGGVAMVLMGFRSGGLVGTVMKIGGLALIYRGQAGYRKLYDAVGIPLPQNATGVGVQNAKVETSIFVRKSPQELYQIWRNLENLPIFMDHLLSVHEIDDTRSVWAAKAPAGMVIKWDAEIINDIPDKLIAWQTLEGSGVDNAGSVTFDEEDGGTRIKVVLRYDPPADMLGIWIAKIFKNDPQRQIEHDLMRFKRIVEIGGAA
jgi:uncharacterized membrane protein